MGLGGALQIPFFRESIGELQDLNCVEWLLQDDEAVGAAEAREQVIPRIVGVGRAYHDLEIGGDFPELERRLHSVPAGWHADIDEGEGIRLAARARLGDFFEAFLALARAINRKAGAV